MNETEVKATAKFRSKERIPALTFLYKKEEPGQDIFTSLWRSSQCRSGINLVSNNRCYEDERMLSYIGNPK
jgi:hypothetical protein